MIWEIVIHGASFAAVVIAYISAMNNSRIGVEVEFLPFDVLYLILMIPMALIILYKTREMFFERDEQGRRHVKAFQRFTLVVASYSIFSVAMDIAEQSYLLNDSDFKKCVGYTHLVLAFISHCLDTFLFQLAFR